MVSGDIRDLQRRPNLRWPGRVAADVYRYNVELATNTRKRFTLPVFGSANSNWSAKLKNGSKTVAKHDELKLDISDHTTVFVGALSDQQAGGPVLPRTRFKRKWENDSFAPRVAHMQLDTFPDDPIALSGLHVLYLNSARAINLRAEQAAALSTWVLGGGHVSRSGPSMVIDLNATPSPG